MKRYDPIDPALFVNNRKNFTSQLKTGSLAIFNSNDEFPRSNDQNFPFRQNSDLFYLCGIDQEQSILMLFPDCPNENLKELLFIRKTDEKIATWEGHKYTMQEARENSGVKTIKWLDEIEFVLKELMSYAKNVYLNTNEYPKYFNEVPYRDLRFGQELRKKFPNHNYERSAPIIYNLRIAKSKPEIEQIIKAIEITGKTFERVLKFVKPGVMEFEVQAEMDHEFIMNRASGHAYQPIVASGKNACVLHYVTNNEACKDGDLMLMDFGAEYANYAADLSRTIPVNGKFSERQRDVYNAVLRVQRAAIPFFTTEYSIDAVNKAVKKMIEQEMIGLGLFSAEDVKNQPADKPLFFKYMPHNVSHNIGLDVHDVGSWLEPFRPGQVLTIEPGIYIPEEGFGIRLENNILVTEGEPIDLTAGIPIEVEEVEEKMGRGKR